MFNFSFLICSFISLLICGGLFYPKQPTAPKPAVTIKPTAIEQPIASLPNKKDPSKWPNYTEKANLKSSLLTTNPLVEIDYSRNER